MDQIDSSAGGGSQNKNRGVFRNTQTYIILAIIVIAAIIYFSTKDDNQNQNNAQNSENQTNEQAQTDQNNSDQAQNDQSTNQDQSNPQDTSSQQSGNVSASGTLKNSDNLARGNLMIESNVGKVYISTVRDFSAQVDKQVSLNASGTLNEFVFLGLNEAGVDTTARGGEAEETPSGNVSFSGKLQNSDNISKGNYVIVSGGTKVYLQSAHDYSTILDSDVDLAATGTLNSFTNATITKK